MRIRGGRWLSLLTTALILSGCPQPPGGNPDVVDSGGTQDTMNQPDNMTTPETGTDSGTDTNTNPETSTDATDTMMMTGICASPIDLNTSGTTANGRTTYTGTNTTGGTTEDIAPPANCTAGRALRQVAHRYRAPSAGILVVSTDNPGTPSGTGGNDTIVWIQTACTTSNPTFLGCNDDAGDGVASTVQSSMPVTANQEVTIIVASYATAMGTAAGGAYELSAEVVTQLNPNDPCDTGAAIDRCPTNHHCIGRGEIGRCVADGTTVLSVCRPMSASMRCDNNLTCQTTRAGDFCFLQATNGQPCNFGQTFCGANGTCLANNPTDLYTGVCRDDGTTGGFCDSPTPACTNAAESCLAGFLGATTCQTQVADGMPCDPFSYLNHCATGSSCVRSGTNFVCAAAGTAAGTPCRATGTACDGSLQCVSEPGGSGDAGLVGFCVTPVTGNTCNPRFHQETCAAPNSCIPTGLSTGACLATSNEPATNNDTPAMAGGAVTVPAGVVGSLDIDDVDCYAVQVPANGAIYAEITDGYGGCARGVDTIITIHDPMGRVIEFNDDAGGTTCSIVDGSNTNSTARQLPAGTYAVCVQAYDGSVPTDRYVLGVNVIP